MKTQLKRFKMLSSLAFAIFSLAAYSGAGCASKPVNAPTPAQLRDKRDETLVLAEEIKINVYALNELRDRLAHTNQLTVLSADAEMQGLNKTVAILRRTRDQIAKQNELLRAKHGIVEKD